ncbi:hypothetical protein BGY98DRAFT_1020821 [Russula aff. rugulosa BPL654]|nr:hypothetical protein BGY98DRAFT_1020821 [Russula aff. rugulosa BPL654]
MYIYDVLCLLVLVFHGIMFSKGPPRYSDFRVPLSHQLYFQYFMYGLEARSSYCLWILVNCGDLRVVGLPDLGGDMIHHLA